MFLKDEEIRKRLAKIEQAITEKYKKGKIYSLSLLLSGLLTPGVRFILESLSKITGIGGNYSFAYYLPEEDKTNLSDLGSAQLHICDWVLVDNGGGIEGEILVSIGLYRNDNDSEFYFIFRPYRFWQNGKKVPGYSLVNLIDQIEGSLTALGGRLRIRFSQEDQKKDN